MAADAGLWLAIGALLYFVAISIAGVALCRLAPRLGIEAEVEIKGPSFRLKFRALHTCAAAQDERSSSIRLPQGIDRQQRAPDPLNSKD